MEVVEALEDTNESVISHRQNDVLRLLTLISVTMLPLSVIASVFGMNVAFPGEGTHEASLPRWSRWSASSVTSAGSERNGSAAEAGGTLEPESA